MHEYREDIRGAIVAVGGGATVSTGDIEIVHQKIELHFHFHGETEPEKSTLQKITDAVYAALSQKRNQNASPELATVAHLPALQSGNSVY